MHDNWLNLALLLRMRRAGALATVRTAGKSLAKVPFVKCFDAHFICSAPQNVLSHQTTFTGHKALSRGGNTLLKYAPFLLQFILTNGLGGLDCFRQQHGVLHTRRRYHDALALQMWHRISVQISQHRTRR